MSASSQQPLLASSRSSSPLIRFLFNPVSIDLLIYFRFTFGGIILWEVTRYLQRGWIQAKFVQPRFFFKYYGFEWVQPLSEAGMTWGFRALGLAAFCVMIGFCYRVATVVVFAGFTYVFLIDQTDYLNHFYLVSVVSFIMCLLPAHRAYSVDAWLRPSIKTTMMPAWILWLIRLQVAIPYFFGAIAKMEADWLSGVPVQIMIDPATRFPGAVNFFSESVVIFFFAYSGMLFDLLVVPALLWKPTRWLAVASILIFNVSNHFLFSIGIFPWFMILSTPLFFPPTFLQEKSSQEKKKQREKHQHLRESLFTKWTTGWKPSCIVSILAFHFAIQIFLPFRHFLYPGAVNWTEEGHRFAWHMKLRVKRVTYIRFFARSMDGKILHEFDLKKYLTDQQIKAMATDPQLLSQFSLQLANDYASSHPGEKIIVTRTGHARFYARSEEGEILHEFELHDYLTDRQMEAMSKRPDMILQLGHFLAKEYSQLHPNQKVIITATVPCSLNSREPQLMIDPDANLAEIPRNLSHAKWIRPLETPYVTIRTVEERLTKNDNKNEGNPQKNVPPPPVERLEPN